TVSGVVSVGAGETLPPAGSGKTPLAIDGRPVPPLGERDLVAFDTVTPGYFKTLGIPAVDGRTFTTDDLAGTPIRVVVSRSFARKYFGNESPLGRRVLLGRGTTGYEIIGEVGDVRQDGLDAEPTPFFYLAASQRPIRSFSLVLQTAGPVAGVESEIRRRIAGIDRDLAVAAIEKMDSTLERSLAGRRFILTVVGIFAVLAIVLAAIGVYGMLSYAVSRRTSEIGVRIALGAGRGDVVGLLMRETLRLAVLGASLGLFVAFGLTRLMVSL